MKVRLMLLGILFCSLNVFTQPVPAVKQIDSLLTFLKNENAFSGCVVLQKGKKIIYEGDFNKFPNGTKKYKIGSVTKVYTAIIIYQLIEEGKLSLTTKLNTWFPEIKYSDRITIDNLLSHTSGIYNVTDWPDYYSTRSKKFTKQEVLSVITQHKPDFKPNSDCYYSNSNYILLGYIIEDVTKESYPENLQKRIFIPLHLTSTYCETSSSNRQERAQSYLFNGETWYKDTDSDPGLPFAAGAIVSTPEEMCQLMYHLFNKEIISDSSLATMKKLKNKTIGHGLFRAPFFEKTGWGHTGRIDEFRSFMGYFPEDSLVVAVTSNGMTVNLNTILIGVLSIYYGRTYNFPVFPKTIVELPPTEYFTGKYKAKFLGMITLAKFRISTAGANHLFMSDNLGTGESEKALLERRDKYVFHSTDSGGDLTFTLNNKGNVKGIKMTQGKMTINCKKFD